VSKSAWYFLGLLIADISAWLLGGPHGWVIAFTAILFVLALWWGEESR
jgi:hypothetical protein